MRSPLSLAGNLQRSQISVQALTRLSSVAVFLIASWSGHSDLVLVALQGTLLAIPYVLQEALLGRPIARGVVPPDWDPRAWATRTALATTLIIAPVVVFVPLIAVPGGGGWAWAATAVPVLLQVWIENRYWLLNRIRSVAAGNLVPQLTAMGTVISAVLLAATGRSVLVAAVPAQLLVLAWAARQCRRGAVSSGIRPALWSSLRPGMSYGFASAVGLMFSVALPTLAGICVGGTAIVVIRALELVFGPFHLLLNASVREDLLRGRISPLFSLPKLLTIGSLLVTAVALAGSSAIRRLVSEDLAATAALTVLVYCAYKLFVLVNTWQGTRHMLNASPARFMVTNLTASAIALFTIAIGAVWIRDLQLYLLLLCGSEMLLITWYALRNAEDRRRVHIRPRLKEMSA
ncbi:hypothetical protein [Actinoplanes sp. DH11]|uniref:hypothetical protein n=1 Tax=Actinoplanes sp. DH11 TaxID=2857011 RepID=UPI001E2E4853|nr:hypothetical protein [Actinoplanes sp. DH11]